MLLAMLALIPTACGGDDDVSDDTADLSTESEVAADSDPDVAQVETGQSAGFDLSSLPEGFPEVLVPPEWDTGQFSDITGLRTVTFESSMSFDDAVAHYDAVHGESLVVGDDGGERLAQWTKRPPWIVSVFEGNPMLIGITEVPEE